MLARLSGVVAARRDRGATMVEYGLMVALIAIVVLVAVGPLGTAVSGVFNSVKASV